MLLLVWQACGLDGVSPHTHAGGFADMRPLPEPQIRPKFFHALGIQGNSAYYPAHVHFGLLPGRIAGPVIPFELLAGKAYGSGFSCQSGKIGFQRRVSVKIADHRDAAEQGAEQCPEIEIVGRQIFLILFDA